MGAAANFLGRFSQVLARNTKWIIFVVRKYPLVGAGYLTFFVWFFFINSSSAPPTLLPQNSTAVTSAVSPTPLVVSVAQTQAYRDGNHVVVRWSYSVLNPKLYANGSRLSANCQPQICSAALVGQANEVEAAWEEGDRAFRKTFRL